MLRDIIPPPDVGGIAGVKVGDRLAVLHIKGGRWVVSPGCVHVTEVTEEVVKMRRDSFRREHGGAHSYAMHRQDMAHYWYSASPVHIEKADALAHADRIERDRIRRELDARRPLAMLIGEILGDGTRYDSTKAADTLTERLSVEQLETLRSWLTEWKP
jgi:hypothetical protein